MKRKVLVFGGALVFFIIDRVVKLWVMRVEPTHSWFVSVGYVPNSGGVFSTPLPQWLLLFGSVIALTCLAALALYAWQKQRPLMLGGASLMLVGGMSNLLDRLWSSRVIDVFTLVGGLSFNLADIYLVSGLLLVVL